VALAQGECPELVERAIAAVGDNCSALDRNSACYGYNLVTATFAEAQPAGVFSEPADRAGLTSLETISTAPLDLDNQFWGVAVMSVQANVPNSLPGQVVTFILMGDVALTNAVRPDEALKAVEPVNVTLGMVTDVRSAPTLNANVIATVQAGTALRLMR
jgi:hypothetical protein